MPSNIRGWARLALIAFGGLLVLLTLLPLWETDRWWVRLWDYPRLQVAALLLLFTVLLAWVGPRRGRLSRLPMEAQVLHRLQAGVPSIKARL